MMLFLLAVAVSTAPDSAKAGLIDGRLEQIYSDLLKLETDIQNRMRSPLDRDAPIGDLTARIKDQDVRAGNKTKRVLSLHVII